MSDLADKRLKMSEIDHVLYSDAYTGARITDNHVDVYFDIDDGKLTKGSIDELEYSHALLKIIDEPIVNAADRKIEYPKKVSFINVTFDEKNLVISIENDGPSIQIAKHKEYKQWIPQILFSDLRSGTNYDSNDNSITGGVNGIGVKLTSIYSQWFTVNLICKNKTYSQNFINNLSKIEEPIIGKNDANGKNPPKADLTKVTFLPDLQRLHNKGKQQGDIPKNIAKTMRKIIITRLVHLASYLGCEFLPASCQPCIIRFNNFEIPVKSAEDLSRCVYNTPTFKSVLSLPKVPYKWELSVGVVSSDDQSNLKQRSVKKTGVKIPTVFININGVRVRKSNILDNIYEQVYEYLKKKIGKEIDGKTDKFEKQHLKKFLFICLNMPIGKGILNWEGNNKEIATCKKSDIPGYKLQVKFLDQIYIAAKDEIIHIVTGKLPSVKKVKPTDFEKYQAAEFAGSNKSLSCKLLLAEGDSAQKMCQNGMTTIVKRSIIDKRGNTKEVDEPALGFKYYGLMTLGGVIMNVRKQSTVIGDTFAQSAKMENNSFIQKFVNVVGLNYRAKYDPDSPTYKKEINGLNYGKIVICVDQDHDGVGHICSLILNFISLYWPNLLKNGFVQRFVTPLIRAIPCKKGLPPRYNKIFNFFSKEDFNKWEKSVSKFSDKYEINYYKGLATHEKEFVEDMFINFSEHLYTFISSDCESTDKDFEEWFGNSSEFRKKYLSTPIDEPSNELIQSQIKTKQISCEDHNKYETKNHKHENIREKCWSALDGTNISGRKILFASRNKFVGSFANKPYKVAQLAGYIAENTNYTHGEQNLPANIVRKAWICKGGVQIPQLLPLSNGFPSSISPVSAQPRYIFTTYHRACCDILYPREDDYILDYTFEEGERCEPKYYLPIIPPIYESIEIPADGWKMSLWAREFTDIVKVVKYMIQNPDLFDDCGCSCTKSSGDCSVNANATSANAKLPHLPPCTFGHTGDIVTIDGAEHTVGKYTITKTAKTCTLTITELPLRRWVNPYFEDIKKKINNNTIYCSDNTDTRIGKFIIKEIEEPPIKITMGVAKAAAKAAKSTANSTATKTNAKKTAAKKAPSTEKLGDLVDMIENLSSDNLTKINIRFKNPTVLDRINSEYASKNFDGIVEFFKLKTKMQKFINLIGAQNEVIEFDDYSDVARYWFKYRKDLYKVRIERNILLREMTLKMKEIILKFIRNANEMKILQKNITKKQQIDIIIKNNYPRIATGIINSPKFATNDEIKSAIDYSGASCDDDLSNDLSNDLSDDSSNLKHSYNYLTSIPIGSFNTFTIKRKEEEIKKLKNELAEYKKIAMGGKFIGANIWLSELDELSDAIEKGRKINFDYFNKKKKIAK